MPSGRRVVLVLVALAGCARSPAVQAPAGDPYVRGWIESIAHHATGSGYMVRSAPGSADSCGISATADDSTRWLTRVGGALRAAERADVQEGDTVEVYVDGPVALSCPPLGRASAIVLVAKGE